MVAGVQCAMWMVLYLHKLCPTVRVPANGWSVSAFALTVVWNVAVAEPAYARSARSSLCSWRLVVVGGGGVEVEDIAETRRFF